jgi:hypothetical protein
LNDFLAQKRKKAAMGVLFWLFREIDGDKVATILVFKSADN